MKSRLRRKKISLPSQKTNKLHVRKVQKLSKKVKARLKSLNRLTTNHTFASKKLFERVSEYVRNNRIVIPENLSNIEIRALTKAFNQFLKSSTSTKKGIRRIKKSVVKGIQEHLSTFNNEISLEEASNLYDLLNEKSFNDVAEKIGSSTVWTLLLENKEYDGDANSFLNVMNNYIEFGNDIDMRNNILDIYNKYFL